MPNIADRFRTVAAGFTAVVDQVPADAWDRPAPCEGWTARDVVDHLGGTANFFLSRAGAGVELPSAADDPAGAWTAGRDAMQAALDDPAIADAEVDSPMGKSTVGGLIGRFGLADVLVHTWDLATAVGLDVRLDPDEVHAVYESLLPNDEMMRGTAFGPKVAVPDDADEQTKLIAFTGRQP